MRTIRINTGQEAPLNCPLTIGVQGENMALQIVLDFSAWQAEFGAGAVSLAVRRSGDATPYPVLLSQSGTEAVWNVTDVDTAIPGTGLMQYTYTVGETVVKTKRMSFAIMPSLQAPGEVPDPYEDWLARLQTLSEETQQNAASAALAASHYPRIIGGEWYIWSVEADAYVPAGIAAQGEDGYSPTVQVTPIEGGHRVTITDVDGPHTFDVMDGQTGAGAVESVNGQTGAVELDAEDVGALPDTATLDDVPDGTTYKRATATQLSQIAENAQDIGTLETAVDDIEALIPAAASANNQLADKAFVNSSVQTNTAHFRGNWPTWADVPTNAADYPADDDGNNTPTTNDYMAIQDAADYPVAAGEDALSGTWRFKYTGLWVANGRAGWRPEYQVNESPLTAAQLAALNSGATAAIISSVGDKLDKTGDGSNVTVAFTAAASRANIATGEKLSVLFGKIAKWFSDLKSAAFRDATSSVMQGSTDLVESGAVYTGLTGKQPTISVSGILKGDGSGGVSAAAAGTDYATPNQIPSVPGDIGAIAAPAGPTNGQYLCWNGSAWVAASLPLYTGGVS